LNSMYMNFGIRTKKFRKKVNTSAQDLSSIGRGRVWYYKYNSCKY
jgi:hypothetical protein